MDGNARGASVRQMGGDAVRMGRARWATACCSAGCKEGTCCGCVANEVRGAGIMSLRQVQSKQS